MSTRPLEFRTIPFAPNQDLSVVDWLGWQERENLYSVRGSFLAGGGAADLPGWNQLWGLKQTGSQQTDANTVEVGFPDDPRLARPSHFRLSRDDQTAEDSQPAGADLRFVGPGDAYASWRETPAYDEWQQQIAARGDEP